MPRWEPDARGRMMRAALQLYGERGYEQTTVADIAALAGLTERTYFRHFADKREVLFRGADELEAAMVQAVESAAGSPAPLTVIVGALRVAGALFSDRTMAQARQAVIDSSVELQERELVKLSRLGRLSAAALVARGVDEFEASVAAETGMAIFRLAFARWLVVEPDPGFGACVSEVVGVVAGQSAVSVGVGVGAAA